MKLEDTRYKMKVIVKKGFYEGCIGRIYSQPAIGSRVHVVITTKGKNCISRFWNSFSGIELTLGAEDIDPI